MSTIPDNTITLGGENMEYVVENLLFYADYSFFLVAVYNTTESLAESSAAVVTNQTAQGGEY